MDKLFSQWMEDEPNRHSHRADMTVNITHFVLTIGRVQLADGGTFSALMQYETDDLKSVPLNVAVYGLCIYQYFPLSANIQSINSHW